MRLLVVYLVAKKVDERDSGMVDLMVFGKVVNLVVSRASLMVAMWVVEMVDLSVTLKVDSLEEMWLA